MNETSQLTIIVSSFLAFVLFILSSFLSSSPLAAWLGVAAVFLAIVAMLMLGGTALYSISVIKDMEARYPGYQPSEPVLFSNYLVLAGIVVCMVLFLLSLLPWQAVWLPRAFRYGSLIFFVLTFLPVYLLFLFLR